MSTGIEDIVAKQVEAYNRRDLEGFLACYAPEVLIEDGAGQVMMRGREAMRGMYGQLFKSSPELRGEIKQRMVVGAYVIDEEAISGCNLPGMPPESHAAAVYRLERGLIVHVRLLM